jgi:hypothetical protein
MDACQWSIVKIVRPISVNLLGNGWHEFAVSNGANMAKGKGSRCLAEALEARVHLSAGPNIVHSTATLSEARYNLLAASAGDVAVFAGGSVNAGTSSSVVDVYNGNSGQWTTTSLPAQTGGEAAGVRQNIYFLAGADYQNVAAYDTETGQWSTAGRSKGAEQLLNVVGSLRLLRYIRALGQVSNENEYINAPASLRSDAITVGTKIYFGFGSFNYFDILSGDVSSVGSTGLGYFDVEVPIGDKLLLIDDIVNPGSTACLVDSVTDRTTEIPVPTAFSIALSSGYCALGSNVVFSVANLKTNGVPLGTTTAAVYDVSTGIWTTVGPGGGPDATATGSKAMFAGSGGYGVDPTNTVDVYSDTNPSPELDGGIAARAKGRAAVVLQNSGDADFSGPYTVQVYAIPPGQYHGAVLLGSQAVNSDLAAEDSLRFSIPISIPANAANGAYHLVAMVKTAGGTLTPFAGATEDFAIRSSANAQVASAKSAPVLNRPIFSTIAISADSSDDTLLADFAGVLA